MNIFKAVFKWKLRLIASWVLKFHKPVIIAITGSVGKTSTRITIESILHKNYRVSRSQDNFNNEFGLPFTILGVPAGINRIVLPIAAAFYFFKSIFSQRYPEVLVLEMGADRPGDIAYLTKIAKPHIAVVTRIGHSHTEFFGDLASVQREKGELIRALPKDGIAVLNADDPRVLAMQNLHNKGRVIKYGFSETSDVLAENYSVAPIELESGVTSEIEYGMRIDLVYKSERSKASLKGMIGRPAAYAVLSAISVALAMKIPMSRIFQALSELKPQPGRLRIIAGIKHTLLIDDSYNASPESIAEALRLLTQVRGRRKIAVLGDMLELGQATEQLHRTVGKLAADLQVDLLFTVGLRAKFIAEEARLAGIAKTKVKEFESVFEAGLELQNRLKEGDVVLIKGSQGIRMEKIVEEVMAFPNKAGELLCRQSKGWKRKLVASA